VWCCSCRACACVFDLFLLDTCFSWTLPPPPATAQRMATERRAETERRRRAFVCGVVLGVHVRVCLTCFSWAPVSLGNDPSPPPLSAWRRSGGQRPSGGAGSLCLVLFLSCVYVCVCDLFLLDTYFSRK